jgi:hypothetical protein
MMMMRQRAQVAAKQSAHILQYIRRTFRCCCKKRDPQIALGMKIRKESSPDLEKTQLPSFELNEIIAP